jgi:hypothetical protein
MNKNIEKRLEHIKKYLKDIDNQLSDFIIEKLKEPEHSGICRGECQQFKTTIKTRKMNTAYQHQDSNYVECCQECFNEIEAHWKEQWNEYYSMIM